MRMPKKVPSTPIPETKILLGGALEAPDICSNPRRFKCSLVWQLQTMKRILIPLHRKRMEEGLV